ncbi:MAG: SprB repeat-containing protein, partial [Eudoraea sp.]|nr:SprB repeat-containing protein [Eudoraea sp.]
MHRITLIKNTFGLFFLFLSFSLWAQPPLQCSIKGTDICCNGDNNGKAVVTVKGGGAPYTYAWNGGITDTDAEVENLAAGTYTVTVTDCDGQQTSCQVTISEPESVGCDITLKKNVSTPGGSDGMATVNVIDGKAPFTYLWDNGETTKTATSLNEGTHTVAVKDADGCTTQCEVILVCTTPPEEVCDGVDNDGDGEVDEGFDSDQDGVADCYDVCEGSYDAEDADGDGIPDGCDDCDDGDDDGDGVVNCEDKCEGSDDTIDTDGDGIPDGCDDCDDGDDDGDGVVN